MTTTSASVLPPKNSSASSVDMAPESGHDSGAEAYGLAGMASTLADRLGGAGAPPPDCRA